LDDVLERSLGVARGMDVITTGRNGQCDVAAFHSGVNDRGNTGVAVVDLAEGDREIGARMTSVAHEIAGVGLEIEPASNPVDGDSSEVHAHGERNLFRDAQVIVEVAAPEHAQPAARAGGSERERLAGDVSLFAQPRISGDRRFTQNVHLAVAAR